MCMGGGSIPKAVQYAAPKSPNNAADLAAQDEQRRRQAASGYQGTILTGSGAGTQGSTGAKTLLGA